MAQDHGSLFDLIRSATGIGIAENTGLQAVTGGDIHASYRLETDRGPLFLKLNDARSLPMFAAEADGLAAIRQTETIRVPEVIAFAGDDRLSFLLLEWLDMSSGGSREDGELGRCLARLHRCQGRTHGWSADNFIRSTTRSRTAKDVDGGCLRRRSLRAQLERAAASGCAGTLREVGDRLCGRLEHVLDAHRRTP